MGIINVGHRIAWIGSMVAPFVLAAADMPDINDDLNNFDPTYPIGVYVLQLSSNVFDNAVSLSNNTLTVQGQSIDIVDPEMLGEALKGYASTNDIEEAKEELQTEIDKKVNNPVASSNIMDKAITFPKLGEGAVHGINIQDKAITFGRINDSMVDSTPSTNKNRFVTSAGILAALAGEVQHVWSNIPSVPNRFVDGNRQYGFAARTWTRSDTGESYDYAGLDTSTGLHTWYTQGRAKKLTYSPSSGEVNSDGYTIATLAAGLNLWTVKIAPIELEGGKVFTYTDTPSYHIIGTFAFLSDIPSVPVKSVNGKTGTVVLTGADIAVSGTNDTNISAALAGKFASTSAAPAFTPKAYALDELCSYNGALYRCTSAYTATAQSTKPDSDTTHWESSTVEDELVKVVTTINTTEPSFTTADVWVYESETDESRKWVWNEHSVTGGGWKCPDAECWLTEYNGTLSMVGYGPGRPPPPEGYAVVGDPTYDSEMIMLENGDIVIRYGSFSVQKNSYRVVYKDELSTKADKPATFTAGNLAKFDANGNPTDSGKKPSDFQSALSTQQLANIAAVPSKANEVTPEIQPPYLPPEVFPIVVANKFLPDTPIFVCNSLEDLQIVHPGSNWAYDCGDPADYSGLFGFDENGKFQNIGLQFSVKFNGRNGEPDVFPTLVIAPEGGKVIRSAEFSAEMEKKMAASATGQDIPLDNEPDSLTIEQAVSSKADKTSVVKTPVYIGGNHAFLSATNLVIGEDFTTVTTVALHRWTMPRKGIVYVRLTSGSDSSKVRIGVNVAAGAGDVDDAHCVTALLKFKNETSTVVPLFLNAGDEVCMSVLTNPLQYVLFSCFYTD